MRIETRNIMNVGRSGEEHNLPLPKEFTDKNIFHTDVAIISTEQKNDIRSKDGMTWYDDRADVCCVGILYKDMIYSLIAEDDDDIAFKVEVRKFLMKLLHETGLFAFNSNFVKNALKLNFGIDVPVCEIKPFHARSWGRNRFISVLRDKERIPSIKFIDPMGFDTENVDEGDTYSSFVAWHNYITSRKQTHLEDISQHNVVALLKDSLIYRELDYFMRNYKIDENGWLEIKKKHEKTTATGKVVSCVWMDDQTLLVTIDVDFPLPTKFTTRFYSKHNKKTKKLEINEHSNLGKYKKKYAETPQLNHVVEVKRNTTGRWCIDY